MRQRTYDNNLYNFRKILLAKRLQITIIIKYVNYIKAEIFTEILISFYYSKNNNNYIIIINISHFIKNFSNNSYSTVISKSSYYTLDN